MGKFIHFSAGVALSALAGAIAVAFHTVRMIGRNRFTDVK